jgi:hypothetical protein
MEKLFAYQAKGLSVAYDAMNAVLNGMAKSLELAQAQVAEAERIAKRAVAAE